MPAELRHPGVQGRGHNFAKMRQTPAHRMVYPAAGLTRYFTGDTLAICNLAPTDQDANADLLISCDIAAAFAF